MHPISLDTNKVINVLRKDAKKRGLDLIAMVRLFFCDRKIMDSSFRNNFSTENSKKVTYNKQFSFDSHKIKSFVYL